VGNRSNAPYGDPTRVDTVDASGLDEITRANPGSRRNVIETQGAAAVSANDPELAGPDDPRSRRRRRI
jgi:hypothetical protein